VGVADEDLLGTIYHEQKSSLLKKVQIWAEELVLFAFALLQSLLLFADWQLRSESLGRDRHFFLSCFPEVPSFQMFVEEDNQVPVLNESLPADFIDIEGDVNPQLGKRQLKLLEVEAVLVLVDRIRYDSGGQNRMRSVVVDDFAINRAIAQRFNGGSFLNMRHNCLDPVHHLHFGGAEMMKLVGGLLSRGVTV